MTDELDLQPETPNRWALGPPLLLPVYFHFENIKYLLGNAIWGRCTLHPAPYTLHPTPYILHLTSYALHPTPFTLDPEP